MATTLTEIPSPLSAEEIAAIDPRHLDPDGPPHPDPATERRILRQGLGYNPTEPDPWGSPSTSRPTSTEPEA